MKFEELDQGAVYETVEREVTLEAIYEFARLYDAQPMHLDREVSSRGAFGDVIASGFQTLALAWGLWVQHGVMEDDGRGGIALEDARWFAPVYPGDRVRARVCLEEVRVTSKGRGLIGLRIQAVNQADVVVASFLTTGLHARRGEVAPSAVDATPRSASQPRDRQHR